MEENRFQIRHGSTEPGKDDLLPYELGYDKTNEKLYMGREGEGVGPLLINSDLEDFGITVSPTELNYLDGVTSNIQTQLNGKQPTITNATSEEIGYLAGVSSNIQEQLNSKQPAFWILPVTQGGTGANNGEDALSNLGIADYIVDQGTSGKWIYRKWNSGIAECWSSNKVTCKLDKNWNGVYTSPPFRYNYPFEFMEIPIEIPGLINVSKEYTAQCWLGINSNANNIYQSKTQSCEYKIMRSSAVTDNRNYRLNLYVIGKYK